MKNMDNLEQKSETQPTSESAEQKETPVVVYENKEEVKSRKERVGNEVIEKYLRGTAFEGKNVSLEDTIAETMNMNSSEEVDHTLEQMGISKDASGKFRLQNPERKDVPVRGNLKNV